jgi:predicted lactoylglutathione lyase
MPGGAALSQLNLVVGDMAATLAFYRRLGWSIETPTAEHAIAELPNGMRVEFDTRDFTAVWDSGYRGSTGGSTVLGLSTDSRQQVDALYADLVAQGARERPGRPRCPGRSRAPTTLRCVLGRSLRHRRGS